MKSKNWYVLKTNPRAEKRVFTQLSSLGLEVYLPLYKRLRQWHDRKKWVDEVLFKSYLFIYTTDQRRAEVFQVPGIVKYLFNSGKIAILTEEEIAQIKIFCKFENISISSGQIASGEEVEIIDGELTGMRGRLQETTKGSKIRIRLDALDCIATIVIDKKKVRRLPPLSIKPG